MLLQKYFDLFESKTRKSAEIYEKARKLLPGGVSGTAAYLTPHPVYVDKAIGRKLFDVDGNEYIDLYLGGFPNILGHSPRTVVEKVKEQLDYGTVPILFQERGIELAEKIQRHMPHLEMMRFCNTGSEATQNAIRAARAWTKKDKIAKMEGGYDGQHDYVLLSAISGRGAGPDDKPTPVPDCAGIPRFIVDNTIILPFNNIDATVSMVKESAEELAAVIIEPMGGVGMGDIPADKEYLQVLRKVTEENNILLIFDEVVTAFRIGGMGGAVKYYGVVPDLDCFGKPVGGGFPIGAFGGRRDVMEKTFHPTADPDYKVFHSGTFTGNPVSMTAGLACLTELETKDYSYIDNLAEKIRIGLRQIATEHGIDIQVTGISSMFFPHFNSKPIRNVRDKMKDDAAKNREFCMGLIVNGVYLHPMHPGALCFAHTEKDIDKILSVSEQVLKEMAE
jgi:glutamate-1-semialdehyde 2,1-aminomutase